MRRTLLALLFLALPVAAQNAYDKCANKAPDVITITASTGNIQVVAANNSTSVTICSISFNAGTSGIIKLTTGTGTNCGNGTADFTGGYQGATGLVLGPFLLPRGKALCVNFSATVTAGGAVIHVP